jgi:phage tail sheath gpL-like
MRQYLTQKHPRDALVDDNPNGIQGFTTVKDLKADICHAYSQLVTGGVMKNLALFSQNVILEQAGDPNRVNAYLPIDVVNQLRVFAANATVFLDAASSQAA